MGSKLPWMDTGAVIHAYRRWAPIYDKTFGLVAMAGRRHVVSFINRRKGRVLEVGVGTGLALAGYGKHLKVTGIDLSPEMLAKAREKVEKLGLSHVDGLHEMDASAIAFPDDSFETVAAMHVMTVVPDPEAVMAELDRVCAPGGEVILVNHFSQEHGVRGWLERRLAPFAELVGWHPVFPVDTVLVREDLRLVECRSLWPLGIFTMLRFVKEPGYGLGRSSVRVDTLAGEQAPARKRRLAALIPAVAGAGSDRASKRSSHMARPRIQARRLLERRYWRSLFRRLASQLAD